MGIRQELDSIRQLVERYDTRSKHSLHIERLALVGNHVNGRPGANISQVTIASLPPLHGGHNTLSDPSQVAGVEESFMVLEQEGRG